MLEVVDRHAGLAPHPERVRLAAWMHDAVYDPRALGDANERDSAEFAAGLLTTLGVPAEVAAEVARLVGLTAGHATERGRPGRRAALRRRPGRPGRATSSAYAAYTAADPPGVRARARRRTSAAGRAQVLKALLELPSIYRLAPLRAAWEERARANLAAASSSPAMPRGR